MFLLDSSSQWQNVIDDKSNSLLNGQCWLTVYPVNDFVLCISGYVVQNNIEYVYGIINCHQILTDSNETSI